MKKLLPTLLLLFTFSMFLQAQDYKTLVKKADALYDAKDYKQSFLAYQEAFKIKKTSINDTYNAACSAALSGEQKAALELLELSVTNGWSDFSHLKIDTDLETLHDTESWKALLAKIQAKQAEIEAKLDKSMLAELAGIQEEDQKYRLQTDVIEKKFGRESPEMREIWKTIHIKDSINLRKVIAFLDKYGWVGADKIGKEGNSTLFLVIQHADLEPQLKYLPMMRDAVKKGNASGSSLALLEDRTSLRQHKRQIYGSQIGRKKDGTYFVQSLDDPDNVDKRRAEVGLGLLQDYVNNWNIVWNVEEYKKQLPEMDALNGIK